MTDARDTRYDAMWQGWKSGLRGADPRECPWEKMTAEWREWNTFHQIAVTLSAALAEEEGK